MRIPFEQLRSEFTRVLLGLDFTPEKADLISTVFAQNSLDGVYSHGLNRFPLFVEFVKEGLVDKDADAVLENASGCMERYNGNCGAGILNARFCMNRAAALAREHGMGCVALRNTNHWMRGGTYGWQAADAGCIGICFTNTIAIMPPWGGLDSRLGNNPVVIAVPKEEGHIVLDMALSQFSFGKISEYAAKGEQLPFDGGFDADGNFTRDPQTISSPKRALPIGFWKGSGLALMLDLLATLLSKGQSTAAITTSGAKESGVSQVFICIADNDPEMRERVISEILGFTKTSPARENETITYPGENTLRARAENSALGIPVDETTWQKVLSL